MKPEPRFETKEIAFSEFKVIADEVYQKYIGKNLRPFFRGEESINYRLEPVLQRETDFKYSITSQQYLECIKSGFKKVLKTHSTGLDYLEPIHCIGFNMARDSHKISDYNLGMSASLYCYLRHIGTLSPLLDWSENPKVAVYFATRKKPQKFVVYGFEDPHCGTYGSDDSHVYVMGNNFFSHPRHLLQESRYTIATTHNEGAPSDPFLYWSHDKAEILRLKRYVVELDCSIEDVLDWVSGDKPLNERSIMGQDNGATGIELELKEAINKEISAITSRSQKSPIK